jgi:hypothetical protein
VACAAVGLVLALLLYVGLIHAGVLRSPLSPLPRGDVALARGDRPGLRVLFVGNSFTARNDMPALVHRLAAADRGAPAIFAVQFTAAGSTLRRAAHDDELSELLREIRWNVVVLQEQSQIPSFSWARRRSDMLPYARRLNERIEAAGARTLLFMTWGYRDGDRANVADDTFAAMQARLLDGYSDVGRELSAPVAPVGLVWAEALRREPELELWAGDGKHPSEAGSFLTACVFYALLSGRDPSRSGFTAGLGEEGRFLQRVAADVLARRVE